MSDRDGESWQRVISGALGRKALNNRARSFTNTRMAKEAREAQAQRERDYKRFSEALSDARNGNGGAVTFVRKTLEKHFRLRDIPYNNATYLALESLLTEEERMEYIPIEDKQA